jgi:hypothetical protein
VVFHWRLRGAGSGWIGTSHGTGPWAARGAPGLTWLLIEIAQSLKLAPGPVGKKYQQRLRSKEKATVAAAGELCCYLYWCLKESWSYDEWLRQHERLEVRPLQALGPAAEGSRPPSDTTGPPPSNGCSWPALSAEAREVSFALHATVRERWARRSAGCGRGGGREGGASVDNRAFRGALAAVGLGAWQCAHSRGGSLVTSLTTLLLERPCPQQKPTVVGPT